MTAGHKAVTRLYFQGEGGVFLYNPPAGKVTSNIKHINQLFTLLLKTTKCVSQEFSY